VMAEQSSLMCSLILSIRIWGANRRWPLARVSQHIDQSRQRNDKRDVWPRSDNPL
jgi:hypothetical protein